MARVILVDASWDATHGTGIGMAVYNRRRDLVYTHYGKVEGGDSFHAEAEAVCHAIKYAMDGESTGVFIIFSDSLVLVHAILEKRWDELPSWRAAEAVMKCI